MFIYYSYTKGNGQQLVRYITKQGNEYRY